MGKILFIIIVAIRLVKRLVMPLLILFLTIYWIGRTQFYEQIVLTASNNELYNFTLFLPQKIFTMFSNIVEPIVKFIVQGILNIWNNIK